MAIGSTRRNSKTFFTLGDFNYSDGTQKDIFGIYRYGFGSGQLEMGNIAAMHGRNHSGFMIYSPKESDHVGVFMGVSPVRGEVRVNTNASWNNYYLVEPSVDAGVRMKIPGLVVLAAYTPGYAIGNYQETSGLQANVSPMQGYMVQLNLLNSIGIGYDVKYFNGLKRETYDVQTFDTIHAQIDRDSLNTTYSVNMRSLF